MTVPRDERVKGLRRRGPWTRPKLKGSWYGRAYRCASKRCAIRFRYTGATFTLVAPRGPRSGRLLVKVDRTTRTVNLHAKRYGARKAVVRIARTRRKHRVLPARALRPRGDRRLRLPLAGGQSPDAAERRSVAKRVAAATSAGSRSTIRVATSNPIPVIAPAR